MTTLRRAIAGPIVLGWLGWTSMAIAQPGAAVLVEVPPVPSNLEVPAGYSLFFHGYAVGTQNYVCLPTASGGFAYTLFTPEATLFDDHGKQIITHFFSPNPNPLDPNTNPRVVADGAIRATWQYSDTSSVWAFATPEHTATTATDPDFVKQGAVAWLLLTVSGTQDGPTGGDTLSDTTFVQRLNTDGGLAPSTGCSSLADVGKLAFMPYTADYFFYEGPDTDADAGN